jgi:cytochrome c-type biogenesis protein CcmH
MIESMAWMPKYRWPQRYSVITVSVVVIVAVTLGLYAWYKQNAFTGSVLGQFLGSEARAPAAVKQMMVKLEKRRSEQPGNVENLAQVAQTYAALGKLEEAERAYAETYRLAPEDPKVVAEYAWLAYRKNPNDVQGAPAELYAQLNRIEPNNLNALWFMGFSALQKGEHSKAIEFWQRMLKTLPPEDPRAQDVRDAIAKVETLAASPPLILPAKP